MASRKKLDRWADKLLDTGKRNNLINFKDTKKSSAEIIYPDCESIFSSCSVGHKFEIFDPKIKDDEDEDIFTEQNDDSERKLTKSEFEDIYKCKIKKKQQILVYAQIPDPIKAVKNIAKRARETQNETGINVAYLAFGFVKWNEKEDSNIFYRAPLLLVHINMITGSAVDPVLIEISDDDVVVNPTFDYFLQADRGLSLPPFEDGDSLAVYYEKVTEVVKKMGWEVIDECKIGLFSFQKINMYEDIKNNVDVILENDNVKALLGDSSAGGMCFSGFQHVVDNPLIDLHTVVDADSSQLEAVEMAKCGKSFVLQGPPGTGKSQTITNIIAECLHDRKKVLFVSEKQAALNVVYDKLKKVGLADFCLELHSHKANKKAVIEELNRTLRVPKSEVSNRVQGEIRQKSEAQRRLDAYEEELHKKREVIEKSLYQLFEAYSAERNFPDIEIDISNIHAKGPEYLLHAEQLLKQYSEYVFSIGQNYRENSLYGFNRIGISFDENKQFKRDLTKTLNGYRKLHNVAVRLNEQYEAGISNYADAVKWQKVLGFFGESDVVTPRMLSKESIEFLIPKVKILAEQSETIISARDELLSQFKENAIAELNGREIFSKLTNQYSGVFSRLFNSEYKALITSIQQYQINPENLKYQQAVDFAGKLKAIQYLNNEYEKEEASIHGYLGDYYDGPDTDWDHVIDSIRALKTFFEQESSSYGILDNLSIDEFAGKKSLFRADAAELAEVLESIVGAKNNVQSYFEHEILDLDKNEYNHCIQKLQDCEAEADKLGNWSNFLTLLNEIKEADLLGFIDQVISEDIKPGDIVGVYKRAFYKHWIEYTTFSVQEIASFNRIRHDQMLQKFTEKDDIQYEISKAQIRSELSQQRPNLDMVAGGSSVAVLRREGLKKRKQMPIRLLLAETGDLVQLIKPCFLMSPLSVSTFLDPDKIKFDTVIFDEASQIFPQDAVGAIYRGKQLIVVGDSKQMPPSNYFSSTTEIGDDDEEIGDITDFESILDICSSVFTTERLSWHYRSHYEQLIAFSNANFYNNSLITFPSAATDRRGIGVDYYHVDGVFDRKSKTNRIEAEYIVDLIYKNIRMHPERSLGVVAFSSSQQNLIDKLLSKRREEDPTYEWFFKEDVKEPFFVKNLETVQGDERDTIIFSIAYARDSQGRFIQQFGPLNREGGERRLNVAVTRAKDNVQLVASIHYTDIDISNTKSEGVRLLRAYLDYAQNGEDSLDRALTVSCEDHFDSYFEQEVCDFLRDYGFTVDTQVGCSGYKIDLGLRSPGSSNYLLAIECDGATYHSSKNARDRDILRQRVLENMGWKFYRIWSTDWYRNKPIEKIQLLQVAKDAVDNADKNGSLNYARNSEMDRAEKRAQEHFAIESKEPTKGFEEYIQVDAMKVLAVNNGNSYIFQNGVKRILEKEAPLSEEYLLKRIVALFGREKVTKVVSREFDYKMIRCESNGIIRKNGFMYLDGKTDYKLRVPGDKREIKYISPEELADGLYQLIKQNVTVSKDSIYRTLTNLLGFSRTGDAIVSKYEEALSLLKKQKLISIEKDQLSLK